MRRHGFDVDVVEDATKADMARAGRTVKIQDQARICCHVVFRRLGVQKSRHENYMIPTECGDLEGT